MMAKVNGFRLDLRRLFFYILYIYVPKSVDLSLCVYLCVCCQASVVVFGSSMTTFKMIFPYKWL